MFLNRKKASIALAKSCRSMKEIARETGLTYVTINDAILGRRNILPYNAGKIAKALNVPLEDIIREEDLRD